MRLTPDALELQPHPEGGWYRRDLDARRHDRHAGRPAAARHVRLVPAPARASVGLAPGALGRAVAVAGRRPAAADRRRVRRRARSPASPASCARAGSTWCAPTSGRRRVRPATSRRSSRASCRPGSTSPTSHSPTAEPAAPCPRARLPGWQATARRCTRGRRTTASPTPAPPRTARCAAATVSPTCWPRSG